MIDQPSQAALRAERRTVAHEADVVVVGAGIFGCAVAYALAQQDRSVILLEKSMTEPNRIVGELLQPGGCEALRTLGLGQCLEGIDSREVYGYHVSYKGEDVVIPYPSTDKNGRVVVRRTGKGNGHGHGAGASRQSVQDEKRELLEKQPQGRSFHHGRFIMQLRRACQAHPNISIFETTAKHTIRGEQSSEILGVKTETAEPNSDPDAKKVYTPDCFFGKLTVVADGYASIFRKQYIKRQPVTKSKFYALELIDCPITPQGFGHVLIGTAYPVLLYAIGTHETRALIDVPTNLPEASTANGGVRGYIRNVVMPTLPQDVRPCFEAAMADGKTPRSMPNSWLPPTPQIQHPGLLLLGDAMNMRHPLTGGGMTVAFKDVVILSDLFSSIPDLGDHSAIRGAMKTFHWRRKQYSSIINVLAMALYSLFAAGSSDRQMTALQLGCFNYFQRGITAEPMGLLGGLIHRPLVLAVNFFSVAFLAIWLNAVEVMSGSGGGRVLVNAPLAVLDAFLILWKACVVFLPVMWLEAR